jgi:phage gp37-like protein
MQENPQNEIYQALETLLQQAMPDVRVQRAAAEDFNLEGQIVARPPVALLFLESEVYADPDDLQARLYRVTQTFGILLGASNLRNAEAERLQAAELLRQAIGTLAGRRLVLSSNSFRPVVKPRDVRLAQLDATGTWYLLRVSVENIAQFEGEIT